VWLDGRALRTALAARVPALRWAVPGATIAAAPPAPRVEARWLRRARALAALLIACWALRIEEFPFTAMQMYSQPNLSGGVDWYAVVATDARGAKSRAPIEAAFPALRDARYRRVVRQSFGGGPEKRALAETFVRAFLREHNARRPPGERLVAVEVQRWRWDFARTPDDPRHGALAEHWSVRAEEQEGSEPF
jgi:hypothetical protein